MFSFFVRISTPSHTQAPDLVQPSDAAAAGFYVPNAANTLVGNAASGGVAGFSFPILPKPIGVHRDVDMVPSSRPVQRFQGNTAHSSGATCCTCSRGCVIFFFFQSIDRFSMCFLFTFICFPCYPASFHLLSFFTPSLRAAASVPNDMLRTRSHAPTAPGYHWIEGACVYFGGLLQLNSQGQLQYMVGRAERATQAPQGGAGEDLLRDNKAWLCNKGLLHWGPSANVQGLEVGYWGSSVCMQGV